MPPSSSATSGGRNCHAQLHSPLIGSGFSIHEDYHPAAAVVKGIYEARCEVPAPGRRFGYVVEDMLREREAVGKGKGKRERE